MAKGGGHGWKKILLGCLGALLLVSYLPDLIDGLSNYGEENEKKQHKCGPHDGARNPNDNKIIRPEGGVKVINLTNSGIFSLRCELTEALNELRCDQPKRRDYNDVECHSWAAARPKLTILYVHGWKHSSDEDDPDLVAFRKMIANLAKINRDKKSVVGVYVAWNANARYLPGFLKNVTFWSKKKLADRIAQAGTVTKIVSSIGALSNSARGKGDQFIAIGHSFGARLLFAATAQSLIYETARAHPGEIGEDYKVVKAATDAVILLNPAFEASIYTSLDSFRREGEEKFAPNQPPLLVSIATSGDDATRLAFPIGQRLDFMFNQSERTTLGNYSEYTTHVLLPAANSGCPSNETREIANSSDASQKIPEFCLTRKKDAQRNQPNNPFIVAETTSDVIKDHNDIWNEKFSFWLTSYVSSLERRIEASSDNQ